MPLRQGRSMSRVELPPQGDPMSPTCRECGADRIVLGIHDGYRHRVCHTCDAPWVLDNRIAPTWETR